MPNEKTNLNLTENPVGVVIKLFKEIGKIAEQKGTRLTTIVTGVVILILILIKNFVVDRNSGVGIDYIDLTLLICAVSIIVVGLIISSLEHKWYNEMQIKEKELVFESYKLEMEYNIKRLEATKLPKRRKGGRNTDEGGFQEPPK